jgi:hypothetical protein
MRALAKARQEVMPPDDDAAEIGRLYQLARTSLFGSVSYAIECGHRLIAKKAALKTMPLVPLRLTPVTHVVQSATGLRFGYFRCWHRTDMPPYSAMSAVGAKAEDICEAPGDRQGVESASLLR